MNDFHRLSDRLGGNVPPALVALWRERSKLGVPSQESISIEGVWLREIFLEAENELTYQRNLYLENNPDRSDGFAAMFEEIDFLGMFNDRSDQFGIWRYANGVTVAEAPVVALTIGCQFVVGGKTIQDFLAVRWHEMLHRDDVTWEQDDRDDFKAVQKWFADRGIATSPSLESVKESIKDLPDPQIRFKQHCKRHR